MRKNYRCAVVAVLLMSLGLLSAAVAAPLPGDTPAEADVRAAAKAFASALGAGNAADAKALCNGGEAENAFIDAIAAMIVGMRTFNGATETAYGNASKPAVQRNPAAKLLVDIDASTISIDGDHAMLSPTDKSHPLRMVKINGAWKIASLAEPAELRQTAPFFSAVGRVANLTAAEVKGGKYDSVEAARDALNSRIAAAARAASSTAPATAPATR